MGNEVFTVSDQHIKLLKEACVSWNDGEFGAPTIDPKRPYGNSSVIQDIAEAIGLEIFEDADGEKHFSREQVQLCLRLHKEMETVLQILLSNCHIEAGVYKNEGHSNQWQRKSRK